MSLVTATRSLLRLGLGPDPSAWPEPGLTVLAGESVEALFPLASPAGSHGAFELFQCGDWRLGVASVARCGRIEDQTRTLYAELLAAVEPHHLARIWNYLPGINEPDDNGLEQYRGFCRGRSLAFEQTLGPGFTAFVPAGSAVGARSDRLTVLFAAHAAPGRHVENPLQIPAYDYPPDYGPRAPSFARATLVTNLPRPIAFLSGTAAIRGHVTIAPGCTSDQLDCLIENLRAISLACGLGPGLFPGPDGTRHFKVYLRHAADLALARDQLEAALFQPGDTVSYLEAEICRSTLNVEVEATLLIGAKAFSDGRATP